MGILRLLLALSVVIAHIGPIFGFSLLGGKIAVQAFFIISGFYMAVILNEKYVGKNDSYILYLSNRFLRIYPLYWLTLLLTVIFFLITSHFSFSLQFTLELVENVIKQLTLFLTTDYLYYDPKTYGNLLIPVSWTLGLELLFYIVAPFVVRKPKIVLSLFFLGLCSRIVFAHLYVPYPGNYVDRFIPTVAVYFFAGAASYLLYRRIKLYKKAPFLQISCSFFALTLIYQLFLRVPSQTVPELFYFVLLIVSMPFLFLFSQKFKFDRPIGDLSYPIYIIHTLCILVLLSLGVKQSDMMNIVIVFLVVLAAYAFDKVILLPIDAIRQARVKKAS